MSLSSYICSIYKYIYIYVCKCPSIYLSFFLAHTLSVSVCLSVCLSVFLSLCLSLFVFMCIHRERGDCVDMYSHTSLLHCKSPCYKCLPVGSNGCMHGFSFVFSYSACMYSHTYLQRFRQLALAQKVIVLGLCFVGGGRRAKSAT